MLHWIDDDDVFIRFYYRILYLWEWEETEKLQNYFEVLKYL